MPALLIKLRPTGPWRIGPDSGDRDRVDRIFHSDSLYSAVSSAMLRLGMLEEWLEATARAEAPAVRFSSCFPFQGETLLAVAPRSLWPPPPSSKIRWKGARFVPLAVVESLLAGRAIPEEGWTIDGASECLVQESSSGPFRMSVRSSAAVDREGRGIAPHSTACLEFTPGSGLWTVAAFSGEEARDRWTAPLTAALRLLADTGLGGERSRGWGRAEQPETIAGELANLLRLEASVERSNGGWWLLSLFHPGPSDQVDWKQGDYAVTTRGGRIESDAGWGEPKRATRMITEGSVVVSPAEPRGSALDVAPADFAHPVYRAGYAVAIPLAVKAAS